MQSLSIDTSAITMELSGTILPRVSSNVTTQGNETAVLEQLLIKVGNNQDQTAYEIFFKEVGPKLFNFGRRYLPDDHLARDLVQDTMLIVWNKAALFDADRGKALTWVFTIARNRCFDMLRRKRNEPETVCADDLWPIEDESIVDQPDVFASERLQAHLEQLPELQREVIRHIYIKGLTQAETAKLLSIPLGTVKSRLRLALERLRREAGGLQ
jgi:RNA polymerase sigma-70 factor (ECF subfamily)